MALAQKQKWQTIYSIGYQKQEGKQEMDYTGLYYEQEYIIRKKGECPTLYSAVQTPCG